MTKWQKGVGGTVTAVALISGGGLWVSHLVQASEDHLSLSEAQETQDRLVELTEALGSRVQLEDAETARDVKLCDEGLIISERMCKAARLKFRK